MSFNLFGWDVVSRLSLRATPIPNTSNWYQIPSQKIVFTKPLMAIWINNPKARSHWYLASNATLFVQDITSVAVDKKRIALRENTFFTTDVEAPNYIVDLWFPWWHSRVDIVAYQSDKPEDETNINLEEILEILTHIASLV